MHGSGKELERKNVLAGKGDRGVGGVSVVERSGQVILEEGVGVVAVMPVIRPVPELAMVVVAG